MKTSLIRPGLLVALRTTLRGGVNYTKETLEPEHQEGAASVAKWATTREITDAEEHAAAVVARGAARSAITRVCHGSNFGLLCLQANRPELSAAIEEARAIADRHNREARLTRVDLFVVVGEIAQDDAEAARAIGADVRELLAAMESGVRTMNPEAIREAANKARSLAGMLSDDAATKVSAAIAEVRAVARRIVKSAGEAGESAAAVVQGLKLEALESARFAVLDLTDETPAGESDSEPEPMPGRAVDLAPAASYAAAPSEVPTLDLF